MDYYIGSAWGGEKIFKQGDRLYQVLEPCFVSGVSSASVNFGGAGILHGAAWRECLWAGRRGLRREFFDYGSGASGDLAGTCLACREDLEGSLMAAVSLRLFWIFAFKI